MRVSELSNKIKHKGFFGEAFLHTHQILNDECEKKALALSPPKNNRLSLLTISFFLFLMSLLIKVLHMYPFKTWCRAPEGELRARRQHWSLKQKQKKCVGDPISSCNIHSLVICYGYVNMCALRQWTKNAIYHWIKAGYKWSCF